MLRLKTATEPKTVRVDLGGGAALFVRPATSFEHMRAAQAASDLLLGLLTGEDARREASVIFGWSYEQTDFESQAWREAAANYVIMLELTVLCAERWEGLVDEADVPIDHPGREHVAILLRDRDIMDRVAAAVKQRVMVEAAEGNGLAVSPSGEAANPTIAPTVEASAPPVAAA